jgi:putative hydrolase of the HAD superfamily
MYNIVMKTILCDIGGVLLDVDFDRALDRLSRKTGVSGQELRDMIFLSDFKEKHDLGTISSDEFYGQVMPGKDVSFAEFREIWSEIFTENREMVDFILSCADSYRLYIASNTDAVHFDYFYNKYPWFSVFRGFGLSFRLNRLKPSPEFYVKLCHEFNIDYRDAIFVDDLSENVDAANQLGIKSHLFVNAAGFQRFLQECTALP